MLKEDNENLSTEEKNLGNFGVSEQKTAKNSLKLSDKLTEPKFLAWSLVVLVVISLIFSATNLFNSLKTPFAISSEEAKLALNSLNFNNNNNINASLENLDAATLSLMDSDEDGLSDYEELAVYKTSPYIPDSDSDGISDSAEVKAGTDPNCPTGQTCQTNVAAMENTNVNSALTVAEMRQWLISQGLKAEDLAKLSDADLTQFYQEAVTTSGNTNQANSNTNTSNQQVLDSVTPDQLRAILRDQGLSDADLAKIADVDLQKMWQEIVKNEQAKSGQ